METFLTLLPLVVVLLVVILAREGLSYYKYKRHCKLHEAAKTGRIDEVRRLIQGGEPVNAGDPSFGLTPLHFAVRNGRVEVARLLIEHGASLVQPAKNGIRPLDWVPEYLDDGQRETLLGVAAGEKDGD